MKDKLYAILANRVQARINCIAKNIAPEIVADHESRIATLCKEYLPSGSGFDSGTTIDLDASTGDKLVFNTAFHHMTEHGVYDGWTEHRVYVAASLIHGITLRITGKDRNDIKDYIAEMFDNDLNVEVEL